MIVWDFDLHCQFVLRKASNTRSYVHLWINYPYGALPKRHKRDKYDILSLMEQPSSVIKMWCLGGFRCETEGAIPFNFSTNKARALLVYLAVEAPRSFRRSHLAGLLWGEFSEEKALHNLRQTMVRLGKGWGQAGAQVPLLVKVKDTVSINPEVDFWVDVLAFEAAFEQAMAFCHDRKRLERIDILSLIRAVDLFKGPFMDRFWLFDTLLFDEWVSLVRERTTKKALEAQTLLCEYYERRGDYVQASRLADQIAALVPWDNQACAHSMRLFALQKQWAAAKTHYEQLEKYLEDNLDVEPNSAVTALYEEIESRSDRDEALPPDVPVIDDQVPVLSSSFVGRSHEISDLSLMLANPQNRLISLVGRGGTGKTRLAVAMARLMRGLYADGVFFIPLRDVSSAEGMDRLLEENLKCTFSGTSRHRRQLLDFLRKRRCLLILDGCEYHLVHNQIGELIQNILSIAPDVKILTTSRVRLNLSDEHVVPLVGLDFKTDAGDQDDGSIIICDAVALFVERARQLNQHFSVSKQTLPLIQELCRRVEGHPLSIELMASSTATLAIPDLLENLTASQNAFDPAQTELPEEGRSLAIIIEQSWQLLSEIQRNTLSRLVCFQGGFTEQAALSIAQTTSDILISLVDKSFIHETSPNRYILHEIIQTFTTQKANQRNLLAATRDSHAEYFVAMLEMIARENQNQIEIEPLDQIEADLENILAAWRYYLEKEQVERLSGCIDILFQFYNIRSLFEEGIQLFENTIHSASYLGPFDPLIGVMTNRLGFLAQRMRQNDLTLKMFTRSLAIFENGGDSIELGQAYVGLGNYYLRVKDMNQALSYAQKALACFKNLGSRYHEGTVLYLLGMIYQRFADYPTAKPMMMESLEISRACGDQRGMISRLNQLAGHDCNVGDFESAEERYLESLALSRAFKDRFQQAIILNNLASVYHPRKEYGKEQRVLEESLAICREIGDLDGEAIALNNLGELAIVCGDFQQALVHSRQALDIAMQLGEDWTIIVVYDVLGCAYLGLGNHTTASQCFQQAIQMAYKIQSWDLLTRAVVHIAEVFLAQGDRETARDLLSAASAHPSILYEYGLKASSMLLELGVKAPEEKDEGILIGIIKNHFNLGAADA